MPACFPVTFAANITFLCVAAIGVKTSNKSKTAAKRDSKVGPAKTNRVSKASKPCVSRSSLSSPDYNECVIRSCCSASAVAGPGMHASCHIHSHLVIDKSPMFSYFTNNDPYKLSCILHDIFC